jgi:hypothetical protein
MLLVVRTTSQPQILDAGLTAEGPRHHVIELEEVSSGATSAVLRKERAPLLIA